MKIELKDKFFELTPPERLLLLEIFRQCPKSGSFDTTYETIGEIAGLTKRQTRYIFCKLANRELCLTSCHDRKLLVTLVPKGVLEVSNFKVCHDSCHDKTTAKKTVEERKLEFGMKLKPYSELYDRNMLTKFYNYWCEIAKTTRKCASKRREHLS